MLFYDRSHIETARTLKKVSVLVLGYVIRNGGARVCHVKLHFPAFLTSELDADEWPSSCYVNLKYLNAFKIVDVVRSTSLN
jgi:hypothetical protein